MLTPLALVIKEVSLLWFEVKILLLDNLVIRFFATSCNTILINLFTAPKSNDTDRAGNIHQSSNNIQNTIIDLLPFMLARTVKILSDLVLKYGRQATLFNYQKLCCWSVLKARSWIADTFYLNEWPKSLWPHTVLSLTYEASAPSPADYSNHYSFPIYWI